MASLARRPVIRARITWLALLLSILGAAWGACWVPSVSAEVYRVYVTRVAQDVYRAQGSQLLIITRYCYQYVYGDSAALIYERGSGSNRLIFSGSSDCAVQGIYQANARLTRLANDVYRDANSGGIVRTQLCLSLALGESALVLNDRVIFIDSGEECQLRW